MFTSWFYLGGYGGYGGGTGSFYPGAAQKAAKIGTAEKNGCVYKCDFIILQSTI